MDLCLELRLLGEGVERLENYVHVELNEVTCCLTAASRTAGKAPMLCHVPNCRQLGCIGTTIL
jgi:hypothetical protein